VLSEKGAEQNLQRAFRAQFEGQTAAVRQAAHSLGLFGEQYITHQGDYTSAERAHYVQLVKALSDWAQTAPVSDATLAKANIATLTAAARATGLGTPDSFQQTGMTGSLQRLGPFVGALKQVLGSYGLALDESVQQMRTGLTAQDGDNALVRVQYPLAGKEVDLQVALVRREQHWYLARTLAETDAVLAAAAAAEKARADAAAAAAAATDPPLEVDPDSAETAAKP
jgi:hypothetical protein